MIRHSVEKLAWASPVASWRGKVSAGEGRKEEGRKEETLSMPK